MIHRMWAPSDGDYAEQRLVAFGGTMSAATVTGLTVETTGLKDTSPNDNACDRSGITHVL